MFWEKGGGGWYCNQVVKPEAFALGKERVYVEFEVTVQDAGGYCGQK